MICHTVQNFCIGQVWVSSCIQCQFVCLFIPLWLNSYPFSPTSFGFVYSSHRRSFSMPWLPCLNFLYVSTSFVCLKCYLLFLLVGVMPHHLIPLGVMRYHLSFSIRSDGALSDPFINSVKYIVTTVVELFSTIACSTWWKLFISIIHLDLLPFINVMCFLFFFPSHYCISNLNPVSSSFLYCPLYFLFLLPPHCHRSYLIIFRFYKTTEAFLHVLLFNKLTKT